MCVLNLVEGGAMPPLKYLKLQIPLQELRIGFLICALVIELNGGGVAMIQFNPSAISTIRY